MDEVMDYEPRVGVDFIYDYYSIIGADTEDTPDRIDEALIASLSEYHPDRVARAAAEFRTRAEHMVRIINDAKIILLDEDKRAEYNEILASWEGPISRDGTPILSIGSAMRAVMSRKGSDEVEAIFAGSQAEMTRVSRANASRRAMHARLLAAAEAVGSDDVAELRAALEEDLFVEESVLATTEAERSRLLGLPIDDSMRLAIGYAGSVTESIDGARTRVAEEHKRRVLGSVSTRLAILSGHSAGEPGEPGMELDTVTGLLPTYFEDQAKQVGELARQREEILLERLRIVEPTYPISEVQTELKPNFVVGVVGTNGESDEEHITWITFSYDPEQKNLVNYETPDELQVLLDRKDYEGAYLNGFNILTYDVLPHIEAHTLLSEVVRKHINLFHAEGDDQLALF